jgi:Uma2 family endonuclease
VREAAVLLTAEEFDNFPFDETKRYELDEGKLIVTDKPAYDHNRVLLDLTYSLARFLDHTPIGEVLISENVYAIGPLTRRSPDVAVILGDRYSELENATVIKIIPEIAAEVISPDEDVLMLHRKLKQYFAAGVNEVWLVDPESQTVEIWTGPKLPEQELAGDAAITSPLLPGFSLPLSELFA